MDKKYFIEDAKCGVTEGGIACGPVPGDVVATVKYTADGETNWFTNIEYDGIASFYLTKEDIFDKAMKDDSDDKEFWDFMNDSSIEEFEGISLGDYPYVVDGLNENLNNNASALIKYLIILTKCSNEDIEKVIADGKGRYAEDLFPENEEIEDIEDFEEAYLDERE